MIRRRRFCLGLALGLAAASPAAPQPTRKPVIGYLSVRASSSALDDAFVDGLREHGYSPGRDLVIEVRRAGNDLARLPALAEELVRLPVDVIVTATTAGVRAAMRATSTIPIVMAATSDPAGSGLVASLGKPGGNVTGLSLQTTDSARKRLQIARELVPRATRIGLLAERVGSPAQGTTRALVEESAAAASAMSATLVVREIATIDALDEAFAHFRGERVQVLVVQVTPLMLEHRSAIVAAAGRERMPALYEARDFVEAGGLASYGPDLRDSYRRAAYYVVRILRGARPADLPVEQPQTLALVVNTRAAAGIGFELPQALLLRADDVLR